MWKLTTVKLYYFKEFYYWSPVLINFNSVLGERKSTVVIDTPRQSLSFLVWETIRSDDTVIDVLMDLAYSPPSPATKPT